MCVCVCVHSLVDFPFWVAGEPVIRLGDYQTTQSKGLLDLWGLGLWLAPFILFWWVVFRKLPIVYVLIFGLDVKYLSANYSSQTIMQEIVVDDSINSF